MLYYKRNIFEAIKPCLSEKEFIIISGARQTGKTTLLEQIAGYLRTKNKIVYQLTLEDLSIVTELDKHPENIFNLLSKSDKEKVYILIDEIQYLKNPSNFLKLLFDKYGSKLKIIATGSSAFYIDYKFKDSLAGRKIIFELYTLSFDEFLYFKTKDDILQKELNAIRKSNKYISLKRKEIENLLNEYLTYGSYPAVVLAKTTERKMAILKELVNSYIKRDIHEAGILFHDKFFNLLKILAGQTGSLVNANELSKTLGLSVSAINNYLYVLQKCFHIHLLKPFYKNIRKELTRMPKVYFNDCGLRNILINQLHPFNDRLDKGALIENYVFTRLRNLYDKDNINFWRTADGNEVDFVVTTSGNKGFAIEVKFNETAFKKNKYRKFTEAYPEYPLNNLSYNTDSNKHSIIGL